MDYSEHATARTSCTCNSIGRWTVSAAFPYNLYGLLFSVTHCHEELKLQIWSAETFERLQHLELTPAGALDPLVGSFFQGVCSIAVQGVHDHVCIGSSTGSLHIHSCNKTIHFNEVWNLDGPERWSS